MAGTVLLCVCGMIVARGCQKGTDVYGAFLRGAKSGVAAGVGLMPALCAMVLMVRLMQTSGLTGAVTRLMAPALEALRIPAEAAGMVIVRPLTGSGSLAMLEGMLQSCGADSRAGRLAAVVMGSSETVFYTLTVYLGATGVKKLPWLIAVSMVSYAVGVMAAAFMA